MRRSNPTARPCRSCRRCASRIAEAAALAGRSAADITLIAVSKTFGAEAIVPVIEAGQRVFGENRVQEAQGEMAAALDAQVRRSSCI